MNDPALFTKVNYLSGRDTDHFAKEFKEEIGQMSGRCIDIGTGPGDVVEDFILPKLNPKATIVCSDISEPMVEFGKEKYKDNKRLSFVKLDIETPNLPNDFVEQFDHAMSFYCINWCRDMRQVFKNIFDLLRPGGTAFLTFLATFPSANAYKVMAAMPSYQSYLKDADRYIPVFQYHKEPQSALKSLMQDVGFDVRHCSLREKTYTFNNLDAFSQFTLATNPFVKRIPAELMNQYEKDLAREAGRQNIVYNKSDSNECEYGILLIYSAFVIHLKKPLRPSNNASVDSHS